MVNDRINERKYRGWSKDINGWVYGAYYNHCSCAVCFSEDDKPEYHEPKIVFEQIMDWSFPYRTMVADVVEESVGEFTGYSKNGREIFEGDIIKELFGNQVGIIKFGSYQNCFDSRTSEHRGFYVEWPGNSYIRKDLGYWINMVDAKILGNIYENPELVKRR